MFVLKKALFLLRVRRGWIQRPRRLLQAQPYAKAKEVALIAHRRDYKDMLELVDKLHQENKHVRLLVFSPKNIPIGADSDNKMRFAPQHFYAHELSASGCVNAPSVLQFISRPYDFALNLSPNYEPYLEYVLKKTHAALKIGFDDFRRSDYHCLLRGEPGNFKTRAAFLYHYLTKL